MIPHAILSRQSKRHHDRFSRFHTGDHSVPILYSGRAFHQKFPLPMGLFGLPSNTWFPGPTCVLNPNGISIGSAVFAGLTSVTDQQITLLGQ